jgi:hypothetical protein
MAFYRGLITFLSWLRGHKWIQNPSKPYKNPSNFKEKKDKERKGEKKKEREEKYQ